MNLFRFFLSVSFLLFLLSAMSQVETSKINMVYNHFLLNPTSQVPALFYTDKVDVNLNYQSFTGIRSDAKDIFLSANGYVNNTHFIGFQIFNSRQTDLFTQSKIHLNYGFRIPLRNNNYWINSTQIGVSNVFFSASGVTPGGSDTGLDASVSTALVLGNYKIGIASHQLPNAKLQPIFAQFNLVRYYEAIVAKLTKITPDFSLQNGVNLSLFNGSLGLNTDNQFVFKKNYSVLFSSDVLLQNVSIGFNYLGEHNSKKINVSGAYQFVVNGRTTISKLIFQTRLTL